VLAPAVALSTVSAVVFLVWHDLPGLLLGRVLSGVSVGVVAATATAYLSELHAARRPEASSRRAEVVAIAANLGGIGFGSLVSGVLAEYVAGPLTLSFEVFIPLLVLGVLAVVLAPETRTRLVPTPAWRPQRVAVPRASRGQFFAAATAAAIAFAAFGVFSALVGSFLAGTLGHTSRALVGAAAFALYGASALAQTLTATRPVREVLLGGMTALVAGVALLAVAVWLPSPSLVLFLVGGTVAGAGSGMLFKGTLGTVSRLASPDNRAEVTAGLFVAAYIGVSVPTVGVGILAQIIDFKTTLLIFATLVALVVVGAARPVLGQRKPAPR
jgi:uncharacterized membrane protein YhaH (DUF805 family)